MRVPLSVAAIAAFLIALGLAVTVTASGATEVQPQGGGYTHPSSCATTSAPKAVGFVQGGGGDYCHTTPTTKPDSTPPSTKPDTSPDTSPTSPSTKPDTSPDTTPSTAETTPTITTGTTVVSSASTSSSATSSPGSSSSTSHSDTPTLLTTGNDLANTGPQGVPWQLALGLSLLFGGALVLVIALFRGRGKYAR